MDEDEKILPDKSWELHKKWRIDINSSNLSPIEIITTLLFLLSEIINEANMPYEYAIKFIDKMIQHLKKHVRKP